MIRGEVVVGGKVKWTYARRYFQGVTGDHVKYGTLIKLVKHKRNYKGSQLAEVWFDDNKKTSKVPIHELSAIGKGE